MKPKGRAYVFLADNSALKADTLGLGYRNSKDLEDKDGDELLEWFTTVQGVDEGDGWIKVGTRFLPAKLGDVVVMAAVRAVETNGAPAEEPPVVVRCAKGHDAKAMQAKRGNCDACGKEVREGENVFDCRRCNWYLCSRCGLSSQAKKAQPVVVQGNGDDKNVATCPKKHLLTRWCTQAGGNCDGCSRAVKKGDLVMDCRHCDWYLCDTCCPQVKVEVNVEEAIKQKMAVPHQGGHNGNNGTEGGDAVAAAVVAATPEPAEGWDQCPAGHTLQSWSANEGKCDSCGKLMKAQESVMDCRQCNWYICTMCSISRRSSASSKGGGKPLHCSKGHELSFWETTAGGECDGCQKALPSGQRVLDCRKCNWYLCAKCVLERRVWKRGRLPLCPLGHHLQKWASQTGGLCDSCTKPVPSGTVVTDCRICDWYVCQTCFPLDGIDKRESFENTPSEVKKQEAQKQAVDDRDLCPQGHELRPAKALAGVCDKCSGPVCAGELVLDCRACNFYMCNKCNVAQHNARARRGKPPVT